MRTKVCSRISYNPNIRLYLHILKIIFFAYLVTRKIQAAKGNCERSRALCIPAVRAYPHPQLYLSKATWKVRLRVSRDARFSLTSRLSSFSPSSSFSGAIVGASCAARCNVRNLRPLMDVRTYCNARYAVAQCVCTEQHAICHMANGFRVAKRH